MTNKIPQPLYDEIIKNLPIVCVDVLIWHLDSYLLVRRKNEPALGQLWFPGGRVQLNEYGENTALRVAKEEVGLDCKVRKSLGVYETIFNQGPIEGFGIHTVNLCYLLHATSNKVKLDDQSSEFLWIPTSRCPAELDNRLKNFIEEVFGQY